MAEPKAIAFSHVPVREDWLALNVEPALDPELPIIDCHHHLWDRPDGTYLYPELLSDIKSGHRIAGTVFVQCRSMYRKNGPLALRPLGEVEFVNGVAAMAASGIYGETLACGGIVGCADMTLAAEIAPILDRMQQHTDRLKGIRFPVAFHNDPAVQSTPVAPPEGLLQSPSFIRSSQILAQRELTLDVWAYQTQLHEIVQLSLSVPDLTIVVDHCGGPIRVGGYRDRPREAFDAWRAGIEAVASRPNIRMKLGGLGMKVNGFDLHLLPEPPTSDHLSQIWQPYIDFCIEAFGVTRCMFESNFPVDKGMVGYANLWNGYKRIAASRTAQERHALFFETARQTYSLNDMYPLG
ncbi:amidohydrolase family protein [Novosphingobium sp.]|uniref:amidohydrolase family protein n=1 Tax=Novosphingobium sp. TaxID=1874826 RepID=UPI0031D51209